MPLAANHTHTAPSCSNCTYLIQSLQDKDGEIAALKLKVEGLEQKLKFQTRSTDNELRRNQAVHRRVQQEFLDAIHDVCIFERKLRPGQIEALRTLKRLGTGSAPRNGPVRGTVVMPTGSGKALVALLAQFYLRPRTTPVIFLSAYIHPTSSLHVVLCGNTNQHNAQVADFLCSRLPFDCDKMFTFRDFYSQTFTVIASSEHKSSRRRPWWKKSHAPTVLFSTFQTFTEKCKAAVDHIEQRCSSISGEADRLIEKKRQMDKLIDPTLIIIDESHLSSEMVNSVETRFPHAHVICLTATPQSQDKILFELRDADAIKTGMETGQQTNKNPVFVEVEMNLDEVGLTWNSSTLSKRQIEHESCTSKAFCRALLEEPVVQRTYAKSIAVLIGHLRATIHPALYAIHRCADIATAKAYEKLFTELLGVKAVRVITSETYRSCGTEKVIKDLHTKDPELQIVILVRMLTVAFHDPLIGLVSVADLSLAAHEVVQTWGRGSSREETSQKWYVVLTPAIAHFDYAWRFWKAKAYFGIERAFEVVKGGDPFTEEEANVMGEFTSDYVRETRGGRDTIKINKPHRLQGKFTIRDFLVNDTLVTPNYEEKRDIEGLLRRTTAPAIRPPSPFEEPDQHYSDHSFEWSSEAEESDMLSTTNTSPYPTPPSVRTIPITYMCEICSLHFDTLESLEVHKKRSATHQRKVKETIPQHRRESPAQADQTSPTYRKSNQSDRYCQVCDVTFTRPSSLLSHLETMRHRAAVAQLNTPTRERNSPARPKSAQSEQYCQVCDVTLSRPSSLLEHYESMSHRSAAAQFNRPTRSPRKHYCQPCGTAYNSKRSLVRHTREYHGAKEPISLLSESESEYEPAFDLYHRFRDKRPNPAKLSDYHLQTLGDCPASTSPSVQPESTVIDIDSDAESEESSTDSNLDGSTERVSRTFSYDQSTSLSRKGRRLSWRFMVDSNDQQSVSNDTVTPRKRPKYL
ncbi:uncharacterized protein SPPG_07176 [Spizellomyces punctatus DAOM BR117]|uniref:C2H2-type domain-containing protein n=1 Tax=Spizellomyces punctatus (strain DAOM BR117) TaxID=645134 RepID=A0A0L0H9Y9_SPIPD|nr:uncharacterized protein SPPG_07176 [Spizellomyces punctatus DAOM BR117]KNC97714.1 hypothetical protein SPPG_07176 [Spizellomyces punctatus DAOM BR117]|eukprot:XP_016605754.1 hypothetical protein SPPG_07176 [Spizellomyces punctatus DAOM BR117]